MNVRVTRSGATYELISLVRYVYDSHQLSRRSAGFPRRIFWLSSRSTQASCSSRFTTLWAWPRLTAAACASSDVMGVAQAYRRRVRQLFEPPRPRRLDEEHADDAGRARSEERAEGTHGGADVALAFLLDQDVPKSEVAVAREVDIAKVVARENPGALRPDVDGGGDRIRLRQIASDLGEPGHDRPDLSGLPQWADLNDQRVLLVDQPELRD